MLPETGLELGKEFEGVFAHDLTADEVGMFEGEVAAVDFFGEDFGDATACEFSGSVDAFGVIAVGSPHDSIGREGVEPFVEGAFAH